MPALKKTMFREYDIRGKEATGELNEQSMYYIGRGFGTYLKKKGINDCIVGNDVRASSEKYKAEVIKGLLECGLNLVDIGDSTTPLGYWAQHFLKIRGLAIVTASHNPSGWNGLKICQDLSRNLYGPEIQEIYQIIESEKFVDGKGSIKTQSVIKEYIADLLKRVHINRKFKILVNTGNGTAGLIAPQLLKRTGSKIIEHNTNIDPNYPNYVPNPDSEEMRKDTEEQTLKHRCDLALAFDGDADRVGLVDEKGHAVSADKILALLARGVLEKHPSAKIMGDVKVSESLLEDIRNHGGEPILWKTGHSLIKIKIKEEGIALAGEMSGHVFFREGYYGFDDGIFAALKLLEYLASQDKKVSEVLDSIPKYISTPMISLSTPDEVKHEILKRLVDEFKSEGYKLVDVDGVRFYTDDGWGLIRASNTTPILVMRFESKTSEGLERLKDILKQKLEKYPEVSKDWDTSGH